VKIGISEWAVKHPTPVILLFVLLTLMGIGGYAGLPLAGSPKVELPIVEVRVDQPGATPAELEGNVARRIEDGLSDIASLSHLNTVISEGSVVITAEFAFDANLDRATQDVRESVSRVRPQLPGNVSEPVIKRVDVSGGVQLSYAVRSDTLSQVALSRYIDEEVRPALLAVPGVQEVTRRGGARREFRVELEPERLAASGLSLAEVHRQLIASEANLPGGSVRNEVGDRSIRITSASASAIALGEKLISLPAGGSVRLDEVAHILDAGNASEGYAMLDGRPVTVIELRKKRGASETSMADAVAKTLADMQRSPHLATFELFNDGVQTTRESFHSARSTLLEGAALTVLVVLLFLRSWRATLVAALAIPFSLLPTFAAMYALGFSLNVITLLALILVIGILVDDAIVEVENIERRIEQGDSPRQAALLGADAIGLAVIAITATIVAVFLPVSLIPGMIGQFFREFGLTASIAVIASLIVARLLTPLLCAVLLKPRPHAQAGTAESALTRHYDRLLTWTLRHRKTSVLAAVLVMVATVGLLSMIPSGFIPTPQPNAYQVRYQLSPGITYERAVHRAEAIRRAVDGIPEVKHVFLSDGGSAFTGTALLVLKPRGERSRPNAEIEQSIRERLEGLKDIRPELLLGEGNKEMSLSFRSRDTAALDAFVTQLGREAKSIPGLRDVSTTIPLPRPGYDLKINQQDAARLGVLPQDLASMLNTASYGGLDTLLPRVPVGNEQVPVRIRVAGGTRISAEQILDLPVQTKSGKTIPLRALATLVPTETPASVRRLDRERVVELTANLNGLTLSQAVEQVRQLKTYGQMPAGVRYTEYGDTKYMTEMFTQFGVAILLGLVAVYAVLVLLFSDWLQPITIMTALPLSLGGAALALLLTGHSLTISTVIGLLMLFAIVGKNSILLVDYIVEDREKGQDREQAVRSAGRERIRPILMTTVAMVGGMLPAAFGFGGDDGFRAPMAIAVVGGLLASTLLSLLFVPVAYTLMDDLENRWLRRRKNHPVNGETAP